MWYCGVEHQREHWTQHKLSCSRHVSEKQRGPQGERRAQRDTEVDSLMREVARLKEDATFAQMIEAKQRDNSVAAFSHLQTAMQQHDVQELARRANIQLRPMMGIMPVLMGLLGAGLASDNVLRLFFGDPDYVRGTLLEARMMMRAPAASPAGLMMRSFSSDEQPRGEFGTNDDAILFFC